MPAVVLKPSTAPSVVLSNASIIALEGVRMGQPARSWVQIAKTGSWTSNRYGRFSITADMLKNMVKNFREITPAHPTQLCVDWDHLSNDPKHPGDGAAAGWFEDLALRADGTELWADISWVPDAAAQIATKKYRFFSPSFVTDHVHKNGEKIGATLLGGAITNRPFLESMAPITLADGRVLGRAVLTPAEETPNMSTIHLAESGQLVSFKPDAALTPELADGERSATYEVKDAVGAGDDQFVRLTSTDGDELGWFRVTVLQPADADKKTTTPPAPLTNDIPRRSGPVPRRSR